MDYVDDPYSEAWEKEELDLKFELLNSEDGKMITLVCATTEELSPWDYAQALRQFANRIDALCSLSGADTNTVN